MCIISTETSSMLTTLIAANFLSFDKQMVDLVASPSSRLFLPHHHNFFDTMVILLPAGLLVFAVLF